MLLRMLKIVKKVILQTNGELHQIFKQLIIRVLQVYKFNILDKNQDLAKIEKGASID